MDWDLTPDSKCEICGTCCEKCNKYLNDEKCYATPPCTETCGFREVIFKGDNVARDFGRWLFEKTHKGFTVLAHNMKGYDGYFLMEYLIDQSIRPDKIIYAGSKIMYLHVSRGLNIRILDSLNFLPMKLSKLPEAFSLRELKKGYLPHYSNKRENYKYVGPYPASHYYGCDSMSAEEHEKFSLWYEKQRDIMFDFSKEIVDYCRSDVDILRQACLTFRNVLMDITGKTEVSIDEENGDPVERIEGGIDPFNEVTIASVCTKVYRIKCLRETWQVKLSKDGEVGDWLPAFKMNDELKIFVHDQWMTGKELQQEELLITESHFIDSPLAEVPSNGYVSKDQFSMISIKWLESVLEEMKRSGKPVHIQHALNGGEVCLPGTKYRLDGYCEKTKTAYEFNGCLWHGCPYCYPIRRQRLKLPRTKQSVEELYTLNKEKREIYQITRDEICLHMGARIC